MAGARVVKGSCRYTTDDDGHFCWPKEKTVDIFLESDHFKILTADGSTVGYRTDTPPFVLVSLDDPWRELEAAATLFRTLTTIYGFFHEHITFPDGSTQPLKVHQTVGLETSQCQARWDPHNIYLPLVCRSNPLHESKGLCPEIVMHEVAHEIANNALYAALGERRGGIEWKLGEQLSDFAAMTYQEHTTVGRFCSSDYRERLRKDRKERRLASSGLLKDSLAFLLWDITQDLSCSGDYGSAPRNCKSANRRLRRVTQEAKAFVLKTLFSTIVWHGEDATRGAGEFVQHLYQTLHKINIPPRTADVFCDHLGVPDSFWNGDDNDCNAAFKKAYKSLCI